MFTRVFSAGFLGIDSYPVEVEVDINNGLPTFNVVGLGDTAISESRERIRTALKNCGSPLPAKRLIVNLSPAGIKKEGPQFDLPICVGILSASGALNNTSTLKEYLILGELSLSGAVKHTNGVINAAICAQENDFKGMILPKSNFLEALPIEGLDLIPVENLEEVINFINTGEKPVIELQETKEELPLQELDLQDVKGQVKPKRALEIAAAGGHNIYLVGSPGSGKSMMAKRLPTILPDLSSKESIECTKIYSSAGLLGPKSPIIKRPPFRKPHHTSSLVALIGGGYTPRPGEISLAHRGVLFLDEANEFDKKVLETLRQPLEDQVVSITRVNYRVELPCEFLLLMAANPCPCGLLFEGRCSCTSYQVSNYRRKLSGPLLDRIDLYIEVKALSKEELTTYQKGRSSAEIKRGVIKARDIQRERFKSDKLNSQMTPKELKKYTPLTPEVAKLLTGACDRLGLSARSYDKALKVARTIADLGESADIKKEHILEALSFRHQD